MRAEFKIKTRFKIVFLYCLWYTRGKASCAAIGSRGAEYVELLHPLSPVRGGGVAQVWCPARGSFPLSIFTFDPSSSFGG